MKNTIYCIAAVLFLPTLTGCPVAMAYDYDVPTEPECVIDQCEKDTCSIETPEGWVVVPRKPSYHEGKKVKCPTWLVEPT